MHEKLPRGIRKFVNVPCMRNYLKSALHEKLPEKIRKFVNECRSKNCLKGDKKLKKTTGTVASKTKID